MIDYVPLVEVEGIDFEVHPKTFVRSPSDAGTNLGRTTSNKSTAGKGGEGHHQVTRVCWQAGAERSQSVLPEQMHDGAYTGAECCLSHQLNFIPSRLTYLCWPA
jgi:hypothetical protein